MSAEEMGFVRLVMRRIGESAFQAGVPSTDGMVKASSQTLVIATAGTDYVAPTGVSGGQTISGGTGSGENLTIRSTAHATPGNTYIGSASKFVFDEVNVRLGIGGAPAATVDLQKSSTATISYRVLNSSATTLAHAAYIATAAAGGGDPRINLVIDGTAGFNIGIDNSDSDRLKVSSDSAGSLETNTHLMLNSSGQLWIGSSTATLSSGTKVFIGNGELFVDWGDGGTSGGGAFRMSSNANVAFIGSNNFYNGANVVYARTGGTALLDFLTTTDSTGGDVRMQVAPSGTSGATITYTEAWRTTGANANFLIGTSADVASSRLRVVANKTVASAAGAVWNGIDLAASTLTLTGTTTVTRLAFASLSAPTITDSSAVTVTTAATLYIAGAPAAGGSATITNSYALQVAAGTVRLQGRFQWGYGGTVASASTLTLGSDGNCFDVSGTTTINYITTTGWADGAIIILRFTTAASITVTGDASSPPANTGPIIPAGGSVANISASQYDNLMLMLRNGYWYEIARNTIGGYGA